MSIGGVGITTDDFSRYGLGNNFAAAEGQNLQAEIDKTERFQDALERAQQGECPETLMNACKEFETYFINMLFKEMRKTVERKKNSLVPRSFAEDYFQENLDEQYSKQMTEAGGIGLAKFLYAQLSGQFSQRPASPFAPKNEE